MVLSKEMLKNELNDMPDEMLSELYDYMKYLKYKNLRNHDSMNEALASEKVLKRDWEKPEEDEAWSDL
ncbi:MAG: hypothetical protein WD431_09000 [Cyclobacteriaceae bacterium]